MAEIVGAPVTDVPGLLDLKGDYNASTNSPDLDSTPISGILAGDSYNVSVAGTFFTEALAVGDMIYALQDAPTLLAHWGRINKNMTGLTAGTLAMGAADGEPVDSDLSQDGGNNIIKAADGYIGKGIAISDPAIRFNGGDLQVRGGSSFIQVGYDVAGEADGSGAFFVGTKGFWFQTNTNGYANNNNSAGLFADNISGGAKSLQLPNAAGTLAVDVDLVDPSHTTKAYVPIADGVDGALYKSFLWHDQTGEHFHMSNAIGIYFYGGTFGTADGSGPNCFLNFTGSDGSAVVLPSQADFAGGGSNGVLFAEDGNDYLAQNIVPKKGATNGELVTGAIEDDGTTIYLSNPVEYGKQSVNLTADDTAVTVSKSFIEVSSDDGTATNRTFTLATTNMQAGVPVTLSWSGANAGEIVSGATNMKLSATWTPDEDDTLSLIFDGTDWLETSRSANS